LGACKEDAGSTKALADKKCTSTQAEQKNFWAGRDDLIEAPEFIAGRVVNLPKIERFELKNRLDVRLISDGSLPVVNFILAIKGGSWEESRSLRSLTSFVARMLTKGTLQRSAEQLAEAIDSVGGKLTTTSQLESISVSCQVLSNHTQTCLDLLADLVIHPTFPEKEMASIRERLIIKTKKDHDVAGSIANVHFDNLLWGDSHVRAWPVTLKSIKRITRADLLAWHAAWFVPRNAILMVAGDVDPESLRADLEKSFGSWPSGKPVPAGSGYGVPVQLKTKVRLVDKPEQTQTQILVGHVGLARADRDFQAAELVNFILGGGVHSSRLAQVMRIQAGLSHKVYSKFEAGRYPGAFYASALTRNAQAVGTLKLMIKEIKKMSRTGPTTKELQHAKSYLAGKYALELETANEVTWAVLMAELHGLDKAFVRQYPQRLASVSSTRARLAAKRLLKPDALTIVLVGKASVLQPQLETAGFAYEKMGYLDPLPMAPEKARFEVPRQGLDPGRAKKARDLLEKAVQAVGGMDRIKTIKDIHYLAKGQVETRKQSFEMSLEAWIQVPDRKRLDIKTPLGTVSSVISPDQVWGQMGKYVHQLSRHSARRERESLWRNLPFLLVRPLVDENVVARDLGLRAENGRNYHRIEIKELGGSMRVVVWLDSISLLVAKLVYLRKGKETIEQLSDYRRVGGIHLAFSSRIKSAETQTNIKRQKVSINAGLGKGIFDKPKVLNKKEK
jgi:zinc protease